MAIIKVENLSKKYRLGTVGSRTLQEDISYWWAKLQGKPNPNAVIDDKSFQTANLQNIENNYVWALKDISFEVEQGEILGIIGRNGAGKSTLLKILSKITAPTSGRVKIKGRIGSLLEVGTGFHKELTGRENIFLNGAILGMRRQEIKAKLDEIIDFSGVEKYIDTPVKRYSSGMHVRLAFAVAAHLDTDILLVDEVLAVGDAEFQKKSLGKMNNVANKGKTVVFVSHNLMAVEKLCFKALLLESGNLLYKGNTIDTFRKYNSRQAQQEGLIKSSPVFSIEQVRSLAVQDNPRPSISLILRIVSHKKHKDCFMAVDVADSKNYTIMQAIPSLEKKIKYYPYEKVIKIDIKLPPLIPDEYKLSFWLGSHNTETLLQTSYIHSFTLRKSPTKGRTFPHTKDHGWIVPKSNLEIIE